MSFSVLNNIAGLSAQRELASTQSHLQKTLFQLASGKRINSGADDAAGLAIADGLKGQIEALKQATRNANDGVSFLQIADGGLAQVTALMHRAVTLAEQSATGTLSDTERVKVDEEYTLIKQEINRIGIGTKFNGEDVFGTDKAIFVGDTGNTDAAGAIITVQLSSVSVSAGSFGLTGNMGTSTAATTELSALRTALQSVASHRGTVGGGINRLNTANSIISSQIQNVTAAESGIRDADMAATVANLVKFQILSQSGISALTQANQSAQTVLSLFR